MRVPGIEVDPARGARIRELREANHLTLEEAASRIGVAVRTYWGWEKQGAVLAHPHLRVLARELGTTTEYLLTGAGPKDASEGAGDEDRIADLTARLARVEQSLTRNSEQLVERFDAIDDQIRAVARAVEELALARPLPGSEAEPPQAAEARPGSETDAPRR